MDLERDFDKRIASIHGLDNPTRDGSNIGEGTMDIRHAEFQEMANVYLGKDFDGGKLWLVESLQTALHDGQAELYRRFQAHELEAEQYVELFNALLDDTFAACEAILGTENFLKLFGAPRAELAGFIDREAFLQANQTHEINKPTSRVLVEPIANEPVVNRTYLGTVQRVADFGALIEIMPGTEGWLDISEIADYTVRYVRDELREGQQLWVKVIYVDPSGTVCLSQKAVLRDTRELEGR